MHFSWQSPKAMSLLQLEQLRLDLQAAPDTCARISILNNHPSLQKRLEERSFFRSFLHGLTPECECALKQLAILEEDLDWTNDSAEKWRDLVTALLPIDSFYREIGGLVGYHVEVLRLLEKKEGSSIDGAQFHSPAFDDISHETEGVGEAIEWGLEALPKMSELYPLGGAADRLHLVDEASGTELPAAKLRFAGRTLLEGLIRDLEAREWLYFRIYGVQCTTPIGMMTSREKNNHDHVVKLCEELHWFGRPKDSFRFFTQPLVPAVNERGKWHWIGELKPLLKPGGHGALWKLARDEGIFRWLREQGRTKALVRQINNPVAGLDYGLLAFTGIGYKREMSFGFASCPRLVKSAEGMNVLVETKRGELVLTNVEYCDFAKFGIEDLPLKEKSPYSRFSSNTNILFVDLMDVEKAIEKAPFPGLLINMKEGLVTDLSGIKRAVPVGRLESTMQNLADVFTEPKNDILKTKRTFVSYNRREKTISVAKKAYVEGKSPLETPEQCFYDLLQENQLLLRQCGFELPRGKSVEEYLRSGPECLFTYHPALGPLYSIIRQKLRRGSLSGKSALILELAEADIEGLFLDGSLQVEAMQPLGALDSEGRLCYSKNIGSCRLKNVTIVNRGVIWEKSAPFWKMDLQRAESVEIVLKGHSEFIGKDLVLSGPHRFEVDDGVRMVVRQEKGNLIVEKSEVGKNSFWTYSTDCMLKSGD